MPDCCSKTCSTGISHGRHRCPVNGKEYREVSVKTVLHHIRQPWNLDDNGQSYYFCDDPECDVVYFGQDDSVIEKKSVRTKVGIKERSDNSLVCYCFGVNAAETTMPEARAFVLEQTKGHVCECEARNPSGRCCLKDFPKS